MATDPPRVKPGILYIDAYDSFSNNIIALLESSLGVDVCKITIDHRTDLRMFLGVFDAVVIGPGPGTPNNPADVGCIDSLWQLEEEHILPVLGICLGFQSLARAFNATIGKLKEPRHGIVSQISHSGASIFEGVDSFEATQYHSLQVNIGHPVQTHGTVEYRRELWVSSPACPDLKPLAWNCDDLQNGTVLMALCHTKKPFYGIQYHPESICSSQETIKVIQNWWEESKRWNANHERAPERHERQMKIDVYITHDISSRDPETDALQFLSDFKARIAKEGEKESSASKPRTPIEDTIKYHTEPKGALSTTDLCEALRADRRSEVVLLESADIREALGRYSILGITNNKTIRMEYKAGDSHVALFNYPGSCEPFHLGLKDDGIWGFLEEFMDKRKAAGGDEFSPFWGGLVGYIPYEVALMRVMAIPFNFFEQIRDDCCIPKMCLAFIENSIVVDHEEDKIYIQSLFSDWRWLSETRDIVQRLAAGFCLDAQNDWKLGIHTGLLGLYNHLMEPRSATSTGIDKMKEKQAAVRVILELYLSSKMLLRPDTSGYEAKVVQCKEFIRRGDSYELCLTDQCTVMVPTINSLDRPDLSWLIYKRLRMVNPAPFAAYIHLGGATILSSSPERFLSWDRYGTCEFRPIKGTVSKFIPLDSDLPAMTEEIATEILSSQKERAENLMIVDLIRHDLHGVVGAGNVSVTQLMKVEEYRSVFQLVSVIEGQMTPSVDYREDLTCRKAPDRENHTGLEVLRVSLPPGSMTGAPKRRSCTLLHAIEEQMPRGIYSGVLGYLDVGGGGDFSVVIRTAVRYDDEPLVYKPMNPNSDSNDEDEEDKSYPHEIWRIGAGGAITALSNETEEFNEMTSKAWSTLMAFTSTRVGDWDIELMMLEQEKRMRLRKAMDEGLFPELAPLMENFRDEGDDDDDDD